MFTSLTCKRLIPKRAKIMINASQHRNYNHSAHYILPVFGLSSYCPSDAIESYLHTMHDAIGSPYILGLISIPLLTKVLIRFPLDTLCGKMYENMIPSMPQMQEDKFESLLTILQKKRSAESHIYKNYFYLTYKQMQSKFLYAFPSIIAFYIHLSAYIAIERMTFHESASNAADSLLGVFATHDWLSSTDNYWILPVINGFAFMFCYAFIHRHKAPEYVARRRNVRLSLLYIPFSALFFSSALNIYILSNVVSIALYQKSTFQNDAFLQSFNFMTTEQKYHHSNMLKLSTLYIDWNKDNFKEDSFTVFTKSFINSEKPTVLFQDFEAVWNDDKIFIPTIPPYDYFRNIADEIDYFDDEYDEFVARIEDKHYVRYLENNKKQIYLESRETLLLDDDDDEMQYISK